MNRFTKIGEGGLALPEDAEKWIIVLDNTTRLMWTVEETARMSRARALKAVKAMRIGGFKDWQLPEVEPLFWLADRTRFGPAIDTRYFPGCKSDWYHTATVDASSPGGCAWSVGFGNGGADWFHQSYEGFVRGVRASQ